MNVKVISPNSTERALIVAALEGEGIHAGGFKSIEDMLLAPRGGDPSDVVVVDSNVTDLDRIEAADERFQGAKICIVEGSIPSDVAADKHFRKPLSIGELIESIRELAQVPRRARDS